MMGMFKSLLTQIEVIIYTLNENGVEINIVKNIVKSLVNKQLDTNQLHSLNIKKDNLEFIEQLAKNYINSMVIFSENEVIICDKLVSTIYDQIKYLDCELNSKNYIEKNNARLYRVDIEAKIVLYKQYVLGNNLKELYKAFRADLLDYSMINKEIIELYISKDNNQKLNHLKERQLHKAKEILSTYADLGIDKPQLYNVYEEDYHKENMGLRTA